MSQPEEQAQNNEDQPELERLQKVLALRGVASRRAAEDLIRDGRVRVNGEVVTELGFKVAENHPNIEVDGKRVPPPEKPRYIVLNKPSGYITTLSDERGRRTVADLVNVPERVVPVGRLDRQTEGLLLLTNDGELAFRVGHPRFQIDKEYEVVVDGFPPPEVLERVRSGITIDGRKIVPSVLRPVRQTEDGTLLRIAIHEGLNRVVRRIFESVNYPVLKLRRVRVGPLQLGAIPRGAWRDLTEGELAQLRDAVKLDEYGRDQDWRETRERRERDERGGRFRERGDREQRSGERRGDERRGGRGAPPRRRTGDRRDGPGDRRRGPGERRSGPGERRGRPGDRQGGPGDRRGGPGRPSRGGDPRRRSGPGERGGPRRGGPGDRRREGQGGPRRRRQERD